MVELIEYFSQKLMRTLQLGALEQMIIIHFMSKADKMFKTKWI